MRWEDRGTRPRSSNLRRIVRHVTATALVAGGLLVAGSAAVAGAHGAPAPTPPSAAITAAATKWGPGQTLGVHPNWDHTLSGQMPTLRGAGGRAANDFTSGNWAGLVETGTTYTAISATWSVPTVQSPPQPGVSATWIGIDGFLNQDLIQTGTEQDIGSNGVTDYYAWYEILPAAETMEFPVCPGDQMFAEIFQNVGSPQNWTIEIEDLGQQTECDGVTPATFLTTQPYSGPTTSAEWIQEMTEVTRGTQPPLADFGTTNFANLSYTAANPSVNTSTLVDMANDSGDITAYPTQTVNTALTVTYGQPPSQTAVTATPNPVNTGNPVTYSATVSTPVAGMPVPAGSVSFSTGSTPLCTATLSHGTASCNSTAAPIGNDTILASYPGSGTFSGSTGTTPLVVNPPPPTQTAITATPSPVNFGNGVTYAATVTPTSGPGTPAGSVAFTAGSTTLCTATLVSGTGSCTSAAAPVGSDTITGQYQSTNLFATSSGTAQLVVNPPPPTQTAITVTPIGPVNAGVSVTYGATVTLTTGPGTPAGSVAFTVGSTTLCTATLVNGTGSCNSGAAPVGNDTITGQYQSTNLLAPSSGTAPLVVNPAPSTQTSVTATPGTVTSGASVTYAATVTTDSGTPTGSVIFTAGSTTLCTASLSSNGAGSCSSSAAPVGTVTITGQYQSTNLLAPSSGTTSLTVNAPPAPPPPPPPPAHGYWLVGSDGGIFTFGSAQFHGSTGSLKLQRPVVGIVPTNDRNGYWLDASDGGIFAFGDAGFYGSIPGLGLHPAGSGLPNSLNAPIVGMVPATDGNGYFMVASDGGVFAFGDAHFAGSCPGMGGCSGAAVAVMPDASGNGYWLVTATGNVYTFGDAAYEGAPGSTGSPVTSAVRTPDGKGYWILTANGTVYPFGDAGNFGSPAGQFGGLNPATAIFATSDGGGYWVASANGTVENFGDAPNDGGMAGTKLNGSIIAATGW